MLSSNTHYRTSSSSPSTYESYYSYTPANHYYSPPLTQYSPISSPLLLNQQPSLYPMMDAYQFMSLTPSPNSIPIQNNFSQIRYDIALDAPTAAAQKVEEAPLTYLNKGQYYNITLKDKEQLEGEILSNISITFYDEGLRTNAADYWKFWLAQQKNAEDAKAIELDITKSNGVQMVDTRSFDRISFKWNGKLGASIHIRFNCLSTDFSRIKGVKGIPLRFQIESKQIHPLLSHISSEKTFCRIKLFRDKGAERKNKDDAKHIERQLEKLRGKNGETHPLWLAYSPTTPITLFREIAPPDEEDNQYQLNNKLLDKVHYTVPLPQPLPNFKRTYSHLQHEPHLHSPPTLGIDPTYIPQRRRRIAKLSVLVKFHTTDIYRAVYLEHLTVKEFTEKVAQRMDIQKPIANVYRKTLTQDKKPLIIKVDDEVIQDMNEEQDIQIETEENLENKDTINLFLTF